MTFCQYALTYYCHFAPKFKCFRFTKKRFASIIKEQDINKGEKYDKFKEQYL